MRPFWASFLGPKPPPPTRKMKEGGRSPLPPLGLIGRASGWPTARRYMHRVCREERPISPDVGLTGIQTREGRTDRGGDIRIGRLTRRTGGRPVGRFFRAWANLLLAMRSSLGISDMGRYQLVQLADLASGLTRWFYLLGGQAGD